MSPFPSLLASHPPLAPPRWPPGREPGVGGGGGTLWCGMQVPVTCSQHHRGERRMGRAASSSACLGESPGSEGETRF